jgi:pimeloyl-ACP methyl ester carboxylesterase
MPVHGLRLLVVLLLGGACCGTPEGGAPDATGEDVAGDGPPDARPEGGRDDAAEDVAEAEVPGDGRPEEGSDVVDGAELGEAETSGDGPSDDAFDGPGDADDGAETDADGADAPVVPRYPIIFLHGNAGSLEDWLGAIRWLVENDSRWSGFHEAGTDSYDDWAPLSLPPSYWLFNFTYYNLRPSDERGEYTAGAGRIGSNGAFWCAAHAAAGHLPATGDAYYADVTHEYAADLAAFVDAVLRATGAEKVDLVGHSMGGLVARSYLQFHEGYARVRRLLLVSSPVTGVSLTDLAILYPGIPRWMLDHEFTEMDDAVDLWDFGFHDCADPDGPVLPWHEGLNQTDALAAEHVTYYVILGGADEVLSLDDVEYRFAEWQVVVPGANHNSIRTDPETIGRIREYLGN